MISTARLKWLILLPLACTVLVSCSSNEIIVIDDAPVDGQLLSFPPAFYQSIVYTDGRLLGFTYNDSRKVSERVSYAYEGDIALHPFDPLHDENCSNFWASYRIQGLLPDGRIGFLGCRGNYNSSMLALNWQTGEFEYLVNGPLPRDYSPKDFSWNPEMTRGVQEMVDGAQGTIYWITPEGGYPMDVEIEDQGFKWNLKDYYEHSDKFEPGIGFAFSPVWSPDGKTIAFLASTYGMRETPQLTANIRYELYFMDPVALKPVQILKGIVNAYRLRWAPDSKHLLFGGCAGSRQKCGLWIYSLETKSITFVAEGEFENFIWGNDSSIIAIKYDIDYYLELSEIRKYPIKLRLP